MVSFRAGLDTGHACASHRAMQCPALTAVVRLSEPTAAPADTWTSTGSYTKFGGPRLEWTAVWRGARPGGDAAKAVACAIIGTTQRWQVLGTRCGGSR
eukprot:3558276-Rhodomonas_salina.1